MPTVCILSFLLHKCEDCSSLHRLLSSLGAALGDDANVPPFPSKIPPRDHGEISLSRLGEGQGEGEEEGIFLVYDTSYAGQKIAPSSHQVGPWPLDRCWWRICVDFHPFVFSLLYKTGPRNSRL